MTWRPIDTAPRDGSAVLVVAGGEVFKATCDFGSWHCLDGFCGGECCVPDLCPTHWMPLPDPPEGDG